MKKKIILALAALVILTSACTNNQESAVSNVTPKISSAQASSLFDGMDAKVEEILNDGSEYAVYLAYPQSSSEIYTYNPIPMRSASMIKVFIMAAVMEQARDGAIDIDEPLILRSSDKVGGAGILAGYPSGTELSLREVMKLMITHSDNTATNMVIDRIGMAAINDYIQREGYGDTVLRRKMMDYDAINAGRENYSSVKDLGDIFLKIYKHECVNNKYDEIMIDFLKGQTDDECFPAAVPDKVVAHKTGALVGLFDDGGIIYGGNSSDVILVIMTENFTGESTVINRMKKFASYVVYDAAP